MIGDVPSRSEAFVAFSVFPLMGCWRLVIMDRILVSVGPSPPPKHADDNTSDSPPIHSRCIGSEERVMTPLHIPRGKRLPEPAGFIRLGEAYRTSVVQPAMALVRIILLGTIVAQRRELCPIRRYHIIYDLLACCGDGKVFLSCTGCNEGNGKFANHLVRWLTKPIITVCLS